MPLILPDSFADREAPNSADDYLWFVEVTLKLSQRLTISPATYSEPLVLRVVNDTQVITWPVSNPTTQTWSPFNFTISPIESNGEGDLPTLQLTVDNTGRVLMPTLHDGNALEGNPVSLYLVPRSGLSIEYPDHEFQQWDFQIASVSANDEQVSFKLERANFFAKVVPQDRFVARRCRWQFGSTECGYVINNTAAFTTCPKTLAACVDRGEDHLNRGLPVLHPGRFGGFPGIPKRQ